MFHYRFVKVDILKKLKTQQNVRINILTSQSLSTYQWWIYGGGGGGGGGVQCILVGLGQCWVRCAWLLKNLAGSITGTYSRYLLYLHYLAFFFCKFSNTFLTSLLQLLIVIL
jgi:hypothetical protein